MAELRSAKQVIDQAVRENKYSEWLCYGFAIAFAMTGAALLIILVAGGERGWPLLSGLITFLFYPAMRHARELRKQNQAIRLLEVPLSKASNEKTAADVLERFFASAFGVDRK